MDISHAEQTASETFLFATGGWDNWRDPSFQRCVQGVWTTLGASDRKEGGCWSGWTTSMLVIGWLLEWLDHFYVSDWVVGRGGQLGVVPRTML